MHLPCCVQTCIIHTYMQIYVNDRLIHKLFVFTNAFALTPLIFHCWLATKENHPQSGYIKTTFAINTNIYLFILFLFFLFIISDAVMNN